MYALLGRFEKSDVERLRVGWHVCWLHPRQDEFETVSLKYGHGAGLALGFNLGESEDRLEEGSGLRHVGRGKVEMVESHRLIRQSTDSPGMLHAGIAQDLLLRTDESRGATSRQDS